jgi:hypothetical protein
MLQATQTMPAKMDDVMVRTVIHMHFGAWPAPFGLRLHYGYGHGEDMVVGKQEGLLYDVNIQLDSRSMLPYTLRGCESRSFGAFSYINIESNATFCLESLPAYSIAMSTHTASQRYLSSRGGSYDVRRRRIIPAGHEH